MRITGPAQGAKGFIHKMNKFLFRVSCAINITLLASMLSHN
jgi:hypothetical protein